MKLTKRGERVRNLAIAVLLIAVVSLADNVTTPDKCKVDVSQMSQSCKDLLYP
jgi:hypothetical protein